MKLKKEEMKENYLKTLEKMGENRGGGGYILPPPKHSKVKQRNILRTAQL